MRSAINSLDGLTPAALSASREARCWLVTTIASAPPFGCAGAGAVSDVDTPTVAIKSSATEHPVSSVAEEATNSEVAEHPKKVARPVGRRPAFCTPPRYRPSEGDPVTR